jgi:hypothetical protein
MTDKQKETEKSKGQSQTAYEKRVQKEMLAVGKRTLKMADKKYAGGVDLDNLKDAPAVNPPEEGKETAETKKAATTKKGGKK